MLTSQSNKCGFTLIEVLVAMMIMMVGLLGLLQTVNLATEQNIKNQMRDEAVQIADEAMSHLKARSFTMMSASYQNYSVQTRLRGVRKSVTISRTAAKLGKYSSSRELIVTASWRFKTDSPQLQLRSIKTR